MATLISQAEYARRRGVSRSAVTKAAKAGRITLIDGRVDPEVADIQWARKTDPHQALRGSGGRVPRAPLTVPGAAPADDGFSDARARRESALAELAELDLAERRGELVRTDDVQRALVGKVMGLRDSLDTLADRLSPLLAAESDPARIYALLREEVRQALHALASESAAPPALPR